MSDIEQNLLKYIFEKYNKTLDDKKQVLFTTPDYEYFNCKSTDEIIVLNRGLCSLHDKGYIIFPNYNNLHIHGCWLTITDTLLEHFKTTTHGMTTIKYCKQCHEVLADDCFLCPKCGTKVESETPSENAQKTYCVNCGSEIIQGTAFCSNCGTKIKTDFSVQPQEEKTEDSPNKKGFYCTNCGEHIGTTKKCIKCGTKSVKNAKRHCRYCGDIIDGKKCVFCHTSCKNNIVESILRFFSIVLICISFFGSFIDLITEKHLTTVLIEFIVPLLLCIFVVRKKQIFKIKKIFMQKNIKPLFILLVYVLVCAITIGGIGLSSSINNNKPNEVEQKLIDYIIENGEYNSKNKVYAIGESTMESGIYFNYIIEYSTETKKLTFKENQYVSEISTAIYTTMYYEYGAKEQKIEVNMVMDSKYGVKSSGVIRPATYTSSNRTIYSFESTSTNANIQSICENNVYAMLSHCQLLMIDADTGLVPFGFEKGLFK